MLRFKLELAFCGRIISSLAAGPPQSLHLINHCIWGRAMQLNTGLLNHCSQGATHHQPLYQYRQGYSTSVQYYFGQAISRWRGSSTIVSEDGASQPFHCNWRRVLLNHCSREATHCQPLYISTSTGVQYLRTVLHFFLAKPFFTDGAHPTIVSLEHHH